MWRKWEKIAARLAAKRAARGAKLLDRVFPFWFLQVNPLTLRMEFLWGCVLRQAYGSFRIGLRQLGTQRAMYFGFWTVTLGGYAHLNWAWKREIASRRAQWEKMPSGDRLAVRAYLADLEAA